MAISACAILSLAACGGGETDEPAPPQANVAPAPAIPLLESYAGLYPVQPQDGGPSFLDHPVVTAAMARVVPDGEVRRVILSSDATTVPVFEREGKAIAHGCEPHQCGGHHWTIAVDEASGAAQVCYHDATTMGERSRWYVAEGEIEMRDGGCPQE